MSNEIDNKVVEIRFDNKQFESGVKTTLSTLDKLKQSLKFKGSTDGLDQIDKKSKSITFSVMTKGIENVKTEFTALQAVALGALGKIGSKAASTVGSIVSEFSALGSMRAGFEEYETQINAIQTIMSNTSNKGTTMEDVRSALDELNTYADKTIYNFTEMTRNIGTFTAAGVDLDTSVKAIQGIANLAAMSGSTSAQASTVMYQLSQALAAGKVGLMDWNSVVNGGMGGEKFQEALKQTAREHGIAVDQMIEDNGSFRDSLQEGWITAEVLTDTLNKFTVEGATAYAQAMLESGQYTQEQADALIAEAEAAQEAATKVKTLTQLMDTLKEAMGSGWTKTWELILGDFDETREFFTQVSDLIGAAMGESADSRNSYLEQALSGNGTSHSWSEVQTTLDEAGISYDLFKERAIEAAREHGVAIDDMIADCGSFEATLAQGWFDGDIFGEVVDSLSGSCTDAETVLADLQRVVDEVWAGEWGDGEERFRRLTEAGYDYAAVQHLVDITEDGHRLTLEELSDEQLASIGLTEDQIAVLRELGDNWDEVSASFDAKSGRQLMFEGVINVIQTAIDVIGAFKGAWGDIFGEGDPQALYDAIQGFRDFTAELKPTEEELGKIQTIFGGVLSIAKLVLMPIKEVAKALGGLISDVGGSFDGSGLLDFLANAASGITEFVRQVEEAGIFTTWAQGAADVVRALGQAFATAKYATKEFLTGFLEGAGIDLGGVKEQLDSFVSWVKGVVSGLNFDGAFKKVLELRNWIASLIPNAKESGKGFGESFGAAVDFVKGKIEEIKGFFASIEWPDLSTIKLPDFGAALASAKEFVSTLKMPDLSQVGAKLKGIFSGIELPDLSGIGDRAREALSSFDGFDLGPISEAIQKARDALSSFGDKASEIFSNVRGLLDSDLGFSEMSETVEGAGEAASNAGEKISSFGDRVSSGLSGAIDTVRELASAIGDGLASALETLGDFLQKVDFGGLGAMFAGLGIFSGGRGLSKSAKSTSKSIGSFLEGLLGVPNGITGAIGGATTGITGVLNSVKTTIQSYQNDLKAETILKIAGAIGILAVSIRLLSSIDPGQLSLAAMALGTLMAELAGATTLMGKFANPASTAGSAALMLGMATAMLILSSACKKFSSLDPESMAGSVAAVSALVVAMGGAMKIMSGSEATIRSSLQLIALATAIKMVAGVVEELGSLNTGQLVKGAAAVSALSLALGAMSKLSSGGGVSSGLGMIGMVASLKLIVGVVKDFAEMDTEDIVKGEVALAAMMAALTAMAAIIGKTKGSSVSSGAGMVLMVTSLGMLVGVIKSLAAMPVAGLATGIGSLAAMMVVFAAGIKLVSAAAKGLSSSVPGLLAFGAAAALVGIGILAAGTGIAAFAAGLAGIVGIMSVSGSAVVASIEMLGGAIIGLIPSLAGALGDGIGELASSLADNAETLGESFKTLFLTALDVLGTCAPELAATLLQIVIEVLEELSSGIPTIANLLFDILIGAINAVRDRLPELSTAVTELIQEIFNGVSQTLSAVDFSALDTGLEAILKIDEILLAFAGAAVLAVPAGIGLVAVTGFLTALGALKQIPGFEWLVNEAGEMLDTIASSVGGAIGNLVGSIGEGIADHLPAIGTDLADFMTNLQPFVDGVQGMDESTFSGIDALSTAVLKIGAAEFLDAITSLVTKFAGGEADGSAFAEKITAIGGALKAFVASTEGIEVNDGVTAAVEVAGKLVELTNQLPREGGWIQKITGETDLAGFAAAVPDFGSGLKAFVTAMDGVEINDGITAAVDVAGRLVELTNALPKENGWLQGIAGQQDLAGFAANIPTFGQGLRDFVTAMDGVEINDGITAAVDVAAKLVELADKLPKENGWLQGITGQQDLGSFGSQASLFGAGLAEYSNSVAGLTKSGGIDVVPEISESLIAIADQIPASGGWLQKLVGATDLGSFGSQAASFGQGLKSYSDSVKGLTENMGLAMAAVVTDSLVGISESIPASGGWLQKLTGQQDLGTFGEKAAELGAGLASYANSVSGITSDSGAVTALGVAQGLVGVVDALDSDENVFDKIANWIFGDDDINKFTESLTAIGTGVGAFAEQTSGIDASKVSAAVSAASVVADIGQNYTDDWSSNVSVASPVIEGFGTTLANFYNNLADGLGSDTSVMDTVASNLEKMSTAIEGLKEMSGSLDGITFDEDALGKSLGSAFGSLDTVVGGQADAFSTSGKTLSVSLGKGIEAGSDSVEQSALTVVDNVIGEIEGEKTRFATAAAESMVSFADGIGDSGGEVKSAIDSAMSGCVATLDSYYGSFYSSGTYVASGFANGISAGTFAAAAKASAMANAAKNAANAALAINSPSRVFYETGMYSALGLIKGMGDYEDDVWNSGYGMGASARDGLRDALNTAVAIADGDVEWEPTVRPVIDLTDVEAGADRMAGMFDTIDLGRVSGKVEAMAAVTGRRNQNGSPDVVSAIDKLGRKIDRMPRTSYSINGITYEAGTDTADAMDRLARAINIEGRV